MSAGRGSGQLSSGSPGFPQWCARWEKLSQSEHHPVSDSSSISTLTHPQLNLFISALHPQQLHSSISSLSSSAIRFLSYH